MSGIRSLKEYKTEKQSLLNYIEEFKTKKILIVGDIMLDSYLYGKVNRISPEAPIPIVSVTSREYRPGGAANVAFNIKSLGAEVIVCSVIGNDDKAEIFKNILKENNLTDIGIIESAERKTTVKHRIISAGQHLLRVDDEITTDISEELSQKLINRITEITDNEKIDLIVFQDYDKGVLTESVIEQIIKIAENKQILTAVDPKRKNFFSYRNVNLFKPNFKEFCEGTKTEIDKKDFATLSLACKKFITEMNVKIGLITLSENGVLICTKEECLHFPANNIHQIADVSGAGDTVISVAGLLLSCNADIKDIAYLSNLSGGIVCKKLGVVSVTTEELIQSL